MRAIVEIGTFDRLGAPTFWHIAPGPRKETQEYCLGIIDEKVFVNEVEIVEWTEKRLRLMDNNNIPEEGG